MSTAPAVRPRPYEDNGAKIKRARELVPHQRPAPNHPADRAISQVDFAALIPLSPRHFIRLEIGEQLPSAQVRDRIVELSGTDERIEARDDDEEEDPLDTWLLDAVRILKANRAAQTPSEGDPRCPVTPSSPQP